MSEVTTTKHGDTEISHLLHTVKNEKDISENQEPTQNHQTIKEFRI